MSLLELGLSNENVPVIRESLHARTFKVKLYTVNLPGVSSTDSRPQGLGC